LDAIVIAKGPAWPGMNVRAQASSEPSASRTRAP
jgi:hypothetical protein